MSESPTGRGYVQGSDSYRADDTAREEIERQIIKEKKQRKVLQDIRDMTTDCGVDRLMEIRMIADETLARKFTGTDDLHKDPNDPNFGDYNVPPGENAKMRAALEMVRTYMKEEVAEIGVELLTPENRKIWDVVEDALKS